MLCRCQIPARESRSAKGGFFSCGYNPSRCKFFGSRPLLPNYGYAMHNLRAETKNRYVAFELVMDPMPKKKRKTKEDGGEGHADDSEEEHNAVASASSPTSPSASSSSSPADYFYVKPLDPNEHDLRLVLDDPERWPAMRYSTTKKRWVFPIACYRDVVSAVRAIQPVYAVYEVPTFVFDYLTKIHKKSEELKRDLYQSASSSNSSSGPSSGPLGSAGGNVGAFRSTAGFTVPDWAQQAAISASASLPKPCIPSDTDGTKYRTLFPYQKEGVKFVLEHGGRAMVCDEMGLGKTAQALFAANCYNAEWPVLVMCPASLCDNWAKEFINWLSIAPSRIHIVRAPSQMRKKDVRLDMDIVDVVIVGYPSAKHLPVGVNFKVVILDECHYIKNSSTQRAKEAQVICNNATRTILLSGTPAMSRPYELLSQINLITRNGAAAASATMASATRAGSSIIRSSSSAGDSTLSVARLRDPTMFLSELQFSSRYCNGYFANTIGFGGGAMVPRPCHTGHSNLAEMNMVLKHFMIRRCKRDVLGQMPPKTRKCLYLSITEKELKGLANSMSTLHSEAKKPGGIDAFFSRMNAASFGGGGGGFGGGGGGGSSSSGGGGGGGGNSSLMLKVQTAKAKIPAVKDFLKETFEELIEANQNIIEENREEGFDGSGGTAAGGGGGHDGNGPAPQKCKKLIIFGHHQDMLNACVVVADAVLKKHRFEYIKISGETSITERESLCNRFRENQMCCVAILSMQAMGTGHNLTCASRVIFTELDWNPSTHLQCEDRVHRIGQEEECLIEYLLADGTADEVVWPMLQEKLDVTLSMIATSSNDNIVLGGGANLQDKEVVQRKDGGVVGGGSSAAAGATTAAGPGQASLDKWFVRPAKADAGAEEGSSGSKQETPPPPAAAPPTPSLLSGSSPRPHDVHTASLRACAEEEWVQPVCYRKYMAAAKQQSQQQQQRLNFSQQHQHQAPSTPNNSAPHQVNNTPSSLSQRLDVAIGRAATTLQQHSAEQPLPHVAAANQHRQHYQQQQQQQQQQPPQPPRQNAPVGYVGGGFAATAATASSGGAGAGAGAGGGSSDAYIAAAAAAITGGGGGGASAMPAHYIYPQHHSQQHHQQQHSQISSTTTTAAHTPQFGVPIVAPKPQRTLLFGGGGSKSASVAPTHTATHASASSAVDPIVNMPLLPSPLPPQQISSMLANGTVAPATLPPSIIAPNSSTSRVGGGGGGVDLLGASSSYAGGPSSSYHHGGDNGPTLSFGGGGGGSSVDLMNSSSWAPPPQPPYATPATGTYQPQQQSFQPPRRTLLSFGGGAATASASTLATSAPTASLQPPLAAAAVAVVPHQQPSAAASVLSVPSTVSFRERIGGPGAAAAPRRTLLFGGGGKSNHQTTTPVGTVAATAAAPPQSSAGGLGEKRPREGGEY